MFEINVPELMTIFATAIMAYLIICFMMGMVGSMYIYFRYLFFPESIEPYLRIVALNNPEKYREYIECFGIDDCNKSDTLEPLLINSMISKSNYVGED